MGEEPMARWIAIAALLLSTWAMPARAGDTEDCKNAATLVRSEPARAVAACRRLAEQGYTSAQSMLGTMYENGEGVPQDPDEAVKWYRKAATRGDGEAVYNLTCSVPGFGDPPV